MDDRVLSTKKAAEKLGVSDSRIRQLILCGELPAMKFGRDWGVKESDLLEYVNKRNKME